MTTATKVPTTWDPNEETFSEWVKRKEEAKLAAQAQRKAEALFKLSLSSTEFGRYAIAVEHGQLKDYDGECSLHAYVLCNDCWQRPSGEVDPRTMVLDGQIMTWLVPQNTDLAVGARLMDILKSIMAHERQRHGGRTR